MIPDFGLKHENFQANGGTFVVASRCVAPGLTMGDLVKIFTDAAASATATDQLRGDPSKWREVRGITAVVDAVMGVVYQNEER